MAVGGILFGDMLITFMLLITSYNGRPRTGIRIVSFGVHLSRMTSDVGG